MPHETTIARSEGGPRPGVDLRAPPPSGGLPLPRVPVPSLPPRRGERQAARSWLHRMRWRLLVAALVAAGAVFAGRPMLLGPVVAPVPVARGDLVQSVVATGRVETPHRVTIASQVTGTVAAIPVAEGQEVAAGQLLVQLADAEAQAAVAQAEGTLSQAEARLRQIEDVGLPVARQALLQNEANLANAQRTYERAAQLRASGSGTEAQLDEARRALAVAEAMTRSARLQLAGFENRGAERVLAETQAAQARASLEVARARLDYARIRAPVAGTLIGRSIEPGWVVQPGQALMVLAPHGQTRLVVQIDEKNLGLIARGQEALASADAFADQRFAARLAYINPAVDPQRASVEVKLDVPDPPTYLREDMTVSVDIAVARQNDALVIPISTVRDLGGPSPWVLVARDGRAERREVELGVRGVRLVEVRAGLVQGELVLPGGAAVAPGARVRLP